MTRERLSVIILQILTPLVIATTSSGCTSVGSSPDRVAQADLDLEQGRYEQALEAYREHRDERLAATDRPDWENPHFYTLLMGDVELQRGDPNAALELYTQADREQVTSGLVADRYRSVAAWFLEHEQFERSLGILKAYRSKDPLLFDALLDKVAKQMTHQEESRTRPPLAQSKRSK